ncbi:hypothetical protein [Chryseobacterium sp.]|uniref:hypothetical protein n=1 Tax=Chryseobacterium sp. TaxID=1871047 RepID=UPI00333F83BE
MTKLNISINKIKSDLANDDFISAINLLKTGGTNALEIFREQRLLLIPKNPDELFKVYEQKVKEITDQNIINYELNYIRFIEVYTQETHKIKQEIQYLLQGFLFFDLKSFFFVINIQLEKYFESIHTDLIDLLEKNNSKSQSHSELSSNSEFVYHNLKGRINDVLFGLSHLVNIFSELKGDKPSNEIRKDLDEENEEKLISAFNLVGRLNTYQYALDQISCTEWFIENIIETENNNIIFEFSIYDITFQKAREIGMQRILSHKMIGRKKNRWLKQVIQNVQAQIFEYAWNYFQNKHNILLTSNKIFENTKELMLKNLDMLDAEDELLVGTSENDNTSIFAQYMVAAVLRAFVFAAEGLKKQLPKKVFQFTYPYLPINEIKKIINELRVEGKTINPDIIEDYICSLPMKRHLDISRKPYIRDHKNDVFATEYFSDGWVANARASLMQGGKTADLVGKIWERYIANILRNNKWPTVIEGLKIKENGKLLTDIDIVAKREHVLLLIQLKVYYGTGINNYEQWKFKKKLEHGAHQVKISEAAIGENINILRNYFHKNELEEITQVKSIVMTNAHYYNGWICNEVPIMSTGSLMQIINGATVKYTDGEGAILSEEKYSSSENLTVDEFIGFIDLPLDWRIGPQKYKVRIHIENLDNIIFKFPIFENEA